MRKILIATHSTFASGILGSLTLLVGERPEISVIDAYIDDSDYTEKVTDFFKNYNPNDEYIVFTDLFGGSVNQKIFKYLTDYDFFLIAGFNLPILLEVILSGEPLTTAYIEELITRCRLELKLVNQTVDEEDSEEDFL